MQIKTQRALPTRSRITAAVLLSLLPAAPGWVESPAPEAASPTAARGKIDPREQVVEQVVTLARFSTLQGQSVHNANGEALGVLSDVIFARATGRARFVVIRSGATLGMGGRPVAVPYVAMRWETPPGRFALDLTPEQLKRLPEFPQERWRELGDPADAGELRRLRELLGTGEPETPDMLQVDPGKSDLIDVEGTISVVERRSLKGPGEHVVIHIASDRGVERVALGPSWYVMGGRSAPMRGDSVAVRGFRVPDYPEAMIAATEITLGGESLPLRDEHGAPAWNGHRDAGAGADRWILGSELRNTSLDCRGSPCGTLEDIVLEITSGQLAMVMVDPDANLLGIADRTRLVPWTIAHVDPGRAVRIDATPEMVVSGAEARDEYVGRLRLSACLPVYDAYRVAPPPFTPLEQGNREAVERLLEGAEK